MFMDAADWWDLNVRLSKQEIYAMLVMFMDAAVGWVHDVHGRCCRVISTKPKMLPHYTNNY
jgi:hypothetical protein